MTVMNPAPELGPQLKQLRLSGILDSLEARNREAIQGKLAYTDYLALLISDEVARREKKKFSSRLRRAQFRTTKTLDQYDFERLPNLNRSLVHDLATGRYLQAKVPVLIVGPCGTGKSHLAHALGHCAVRQGVDVIFTTCASLTQSLNAARATGGCERKLATLARVPLLIIDDFGLKPLRSPADEDLHDLIAERYEQASTIVTSNLVLASRVRQATRFCDALSEAGFVSGVIVANQATAPVTEEGAGVFPGAGFAEVIDHGAHGFKCTRRIGPQVGPVRLAVARLEHGLDHVRVQPMRQGHTPHAGTGLRARSHQLRLECFAVFAPARPAFV